jgi:hypothetical protein
MFSAAASASEITRTPLITVVRPAATSCSAFFQLMTCR